MVDAQGADVAVLMVLATVVMLAMVMAVVIFTVFSRKKILEKELEKVRAEENHEAEQNRLRISVAVNSREKEKEELSRYLHDDINARLSLLHSGLNKEIGGSKELGVQSHLDEINQVREDLRKLSHELLPSSLQQFGLKKGLEELSSSFEASSDSIEFEINAEERLSKVKADKSKIIYRICQEMFANAAKHSKATKVSVDFFSDDDSTTMIYYDNGVGLTTESVHGNGLENINTYTRYLEGKLSIENIGSGGLEISLHIPNSAIYEKKH